MVGLQPSALAGAVSSVRCKSMGYDRRARGYDYSEHSRSPNQSLDPALKYLRNLGFERRITLLALLSGLPAVGTTILLLWLFDFSARTQLTVDLFLLLIWLGVAFNLKHRV